MSNLAVFDNRDFGQIRALVDAQGAPAFVAKDVCLALGIGKYRDAVSTIDDDERGSVLVDTPGGKQQMTTVTEPGFYKLVMLMTAICCSPPRVPTVRVPFSSSSRRRVSFSASR